MNIIKQEQKIIEDAAAGRWRKREEETAEPTIWRPPQVHPMRCSGVVLLFQKGGRTPWKGDDNYVSQPHIEINGQGGWTRTNVDRSRRVYSPLQLPLCDSPICRAGNFPCPHCGAQVRRPHIIIRGFTLLLVQIAGLEPARAFAHQSLKLACLPTTTYLHNTSSLT